jgi:hypothetical protein
MADNTQLDVGTGGDILATASMTFSGDTAVFQIVGGTILSGSEGSWTQTLLVGGAGVVTGGVQRVTLASDDPAVTDLAAMEVLLTTIDSDTNDIKTAVELIDNAISGSEMQVDLVKAGSVLDANNSTTTPLGGDAVFTGTGTDLLGYSAVCITLYADVDSATNGMTFQFSSDNSNWDDVYSFEMDVSESDTRRFQFPVTARYFRIVYTNGAGAQSAFRVQTILHTSNQLTSIHRLKDDMSEDRSAQVVKAAIFGAGQGGSPDYKAVDVTNGGNLKVSVEEIVALAAGDSNIGNVDIVTLPAGNLGQQAMAASLSVVPASDITDATYIGDIKFGESLPAGSAAIGKLAANTGVDIGDVTINNADTAQVPVSINTVKDGSGTAYSPLSDADGHQQVDVLSAPTTAVTQSGTWTVQPGNTPNSSAWLVNDRPATTGGLTMDRTISAASTNSTNVKASAGQLYSVQVFNTNAAARYLKLYNDASAPTVGTDTPVKTMTIPGNTAGAGLVINWDKGLTFSNGIGFGLTTGVADNDTGAVAANELVVNIDYK